MLAIDNSSEWVRVQILDGDAGAAEMTQELQDAGIDGEVQALPSTPDYVGRWIGLALGKQEPPRPCDVPEDAEPGLDCTNPPLLAGDDVSFAGDSFRIRRDAIYLLGTTRTTFYVGGEPEPGEQPVESLPRGAVFLYPTPDAGVQGDFREPGDPQVK